VVEIRTLVLEYGRLGDGLWSPMYSTGKPGQNEEEQTQQQNIAGRRFRNRRKSSPPAPPVKY
jgi:hypothetical protein